MKVDAWWFAPLNHSAVGSSSLSLALGTTSGSLLRTRRSQVRVLQGDQILSPPISYRICRPRDRREPFWVAVESSLQREMTFPEDSRALSPHPNQLPRPLPFSCPLHAPTELEVLVPPRVESWPYWPTCTVGVAICGERRPVLAHDLVSVSSKGVLPAAASRVGRPNASGRPIHGTRHAPPCQHRLC